MADTNGDKAVDPKLLKRSVVETPEQTGATPTQSLTGADNTLLWLVSQAADDMEVWGRHTKVRDAQLRQFITKESYFASSLGIVTSRNVGFDYYIEGSPRTAERAQDILENANQGRGWQDFVAKLSQDLYTQDTSPAFEIVRDGVGMDAAPVAINSLDAAATWHTGDPLKPVVYRDLKNTWHVMDWWNVVVVSEMPTPVERLFGIQMCALTRLLLQAQKMRSIFIYQMEKISGRQTRAVHLVGGFSTAQIEDSLAQMRAAADSQGLLRYLNPIIIGAIDPQATISKETLELATLPDGFSSKDELSAYIDHIAMAFFSDRQDFAPLTGGNIGTSAQSEVLHQKTRGKGPALFRKLLTHAINSRMLPKNVEFGYSEQDLEAEKMEAEIAKARADERAVRIASTEISPDEARQLAMDAGDLPVEMFEAQGAVDATPEIRNFDAPGRGPNGRGPNGRGPDNDDITVEEGDTARGKDAVRPAWLNRSANWYS